jgi:protein TonB
VTIADAAPDALERSASAKSLRRSVLDAPLLPSRRVPILAAFGTTALHATVVAAAFAAGMRGMAKQPGSAPVSQMVEVELPPPPKAEPPPEHPPDTAPEPPAATAAPKPAPRARPAAAPREAPPPAAAQAGKVLESAPEVVDFGETFVGGQGASFAGGVTERGGTATHAVRDTRARAGGVEGATGKNLQGDLSRAPQLAGGAEWDCPFPPEADSADIDHALVTLRVAVDAGGAVQSVNATADPGHGFGREARRCAQSKRWAPGRDRAGSPTSAVALVNVRFDR